MRGTPVGQPQLLRGGWLDDLVGQRIEPRELLGVDNAGYEMRLVEIPDLHFAAVWLAPTDTEKGVLLAFAPIGSVERHASVSVSKFRSIAKDAAREQLRAWREVRPPTAIIVEGFGYFARGAEKLIDTVVRAL